MAMKIIAEIGQAHDGSLGILHSFIDAVADCGADAIKFQTHVAEAESSIHEPFRVNFSYEDKTRYDYWQRMEFTFEQWQGIKQHCDEREIEFMSSPFSCRAVEMLEQLEMKTWKVGSGEVSNFLLLERIARTGGDMLLSSGMSSFAELDNTIDFLKRKQASIAGIFQCTTQYPTPADQLGLNVIGELKQRYHLPIGLSDHSGEIFPALAAVSLGAEIFEAHVCFDKKMFGPDSTSSLNLTQLDQLVRGVRFLESSLSSPVDKSDNSRFAPLKSIFEKSLCVNKDLPAGAVLTIDDLEGKKPAGMGIPGSAYETVLGRSLKRKLERYEFLNEGDMN